MYRDLDSLQKAKKYYEHALDIFVKQLGSNHVKVATSYNNLGYVNELLGDLYQAKHYRQLARGSLSKQQDE